MRHRFTVAVAILIVLTGWLTFPATRSQGPVVSALPSKSSPFQLQGAGSCASASCHNSNDPTRIKGREYALCLTDKHDRAYAVLLDERSKKIEQRYHGLGEWQSAQPQLDLLCLKCHVHPEIDRDAVKEVNGVRQFRFDDGVSCEACHGPAQRWLDLHHRPDWQTLSADDKRTHFGMSDTRGIRGRAESCVPCHVGAPGMEVNHDLIAAGHPRLAFEFSSYHSLMTKHWDDARDRDPSRGGNTDFEAQAWTTGQIVTLKAALELLHHRSERKAWPEFAEFDCYACHHDLRNPGGKQDRDFPGRVAGRMQWNRWTTAHFETAFAFLRGKSDPAVEQGLQTIRQEMNKLVPNDDVLSREIPKVVSLLEQALLQREAAAREIPVREAMARIVKSPVQTWDDAAQTYIGLAAWERTRLDRRQPEIGGLRPNLELLRKLLLPDARYRLIDVGATTERIARDLKTDSNKQ